MKLQCNKLLFFKFICLIGCLIQLYIITKEYFEYKVRNDVSFEYTLHVELPALDFRVPLTTIVNLTELCYLHPEEMLNVNGNSYNRKTNGSDYMDCENAKFDLLNFDEYSLKFITFGDIVNISERSDFGFNMAWNELTYYENEMCKTKLYINSFAIFYRLDCRENGRMHKRILLDVSGVDAYVLFGITLKIPFGVRLSDFDLAPSVSAESYTTISEHKSDNYISYIKMSQKSLEYPYETNCRHYDRIATLQKCINANTLIHDPGHLIGYVLHEEQMYDQYANHTFDLTFKNEIYRNCLETVRDPECEHNTYTMTFYQNEWHTKLYQKFLTTKNNQSLTAFSLTAPTEPEHRIIAYPAFPLVDYLIYIGSILGLWFGFSIIDGFQFNVTKLFISFGKTLIKLTKSPF